MAPRGDFLRQWEAGLKYLPNPFLRYERGATQSPHPSRMSPLWAEGRLGRDRSRVADSYRGRGKTRRESILHARVGHHRNAHADYRVTVPTVYITAPRGAASDLARLLVDERLAACVNVVECESTYRWEGDVLVDDEAILLAKTTAEKYDDLVERVVEAHPADVPCIERFEEGALLPSFARWRDEVVG